MRQKIYDASFALLPLMLFFESKWMAWLILVWGALALVRAETLRQNASREAGLYPMLLLLLAWPLVTSLWSISPPATLDMWLRIAVMFLCGAVALVSPVSRPLPPKLLVWMVILAALSLLVLLVAMLPPVKPLLMRWGISLPVLLIITADRAMCAFSVMVWPLAAGLQRIGERRLACGLVVLAAMAVGLLHSLSAMLGFTVGLLSWGLVCLLPVSGAWLLMILAPLVVAVGPFAVDWFVHLPFTPAQLGLLQSLSSGRLLIWQGLVDAGAGHPLLGWGMQASRLLKLTSAQLGTMHMDATPLHPHCSVLQVWLELGLVGLVLYASAVALMLRTVAARLRGNPELALGMAAVMAYLGAEFSSFSIWQNWWAALPWIVLVVWRRLPPAASSAS